MPSGKNVNSCNRALEKLILAVLFAAEQQHFASQVGTVHGQIVAIILNLESCVAIVVGEWGMAEAFFCPQGVCAH